MSWLDSKAGSERSSVGVHMTNEAQRRSTAQGRPKTGENAVKAAYSAPRLLKIGDFARLTRGGVGNGHDSGGGGGAASTHV